MKNAEINKLSVEDIKTKIRTYKKSISKEYKNKNGENPSLKQRREIMSKKTMNDFLRCENKIEKLDLKQPTL